MAFRRQQGLYSQTVERMQIASYRVLTTYCCTRFLRQDEGDNDGTGGPYIYAGSSCPSEDGSSSDGRLDSDNDIDPRRVLHAHGSAFDRLADVASFSEDSEHRLGQTLGASEGVRTFDNPFRTGLGDAEALAYGPQRSDGESSSDDL